MTFSPPSTPSDAGLLRSVLRLSRELSLSEAPGLLHRRKVLSLARKARLLSHLFEELDAQLPDLPRSAVLCFREILVVLQRCKVLLTDCSAWSRMRLLLQSETVSSEFHELNVELSTLLDILPVAELDVADDMRDILDLLRRQCRRSSADVDAAEAALRREILDMIREIEKEVVPERSRLEKIFQTLGLDDSASCRDEIETLEREIGEKVSENWMAAMVALVGLLRYAKCVLFGASTPRSGNMGKFSFSEMELVVPADFRCPISLELMRDPVVAASGQTYDRESITKWLASGHATCPKTGQVLAHTNLVANRALKSLISRWCRENQVPFEDAEAAKAETNASSVNKAAMEAARMTASFLVERLASAETEESASRMVHELREMARLGAENRAVVGDAGAVAQLVPLLLRAHGAGLQLGAVTALFNLSLLDANRRRLMHAEGAVDAIVHVLAGGNTWQAKENAAATLLSLSSNHSYRRRLGRIQRVVDGLVKLVNEGPASAKKDGLAAILSLAGDRENVARIVAGGAVEAALEAAGTADTAEEAVAVLAAVAKRGGAEAVCAAEGSIKVLVRVLRRGPDLARENAAVTLVLVCRRAGGDAVAKVVATAGIEWVIWEMMHWGTERARRKAAALGRICRRWLAAQEANETVNFSAATIAASTAVA